MEYLSIEDAAEKWGISLRRVQRLCADGRIHNAEKIGGYWIIPAETEKPEDRRFGPKKEKESAGERTAT